jgi:large subunit ribosomal protein L28
MAKICPVTKKGSVVGGGFSNRTRATQFNPTGKTRRYPNLQKRRVYIPELKKHVRVLISTRGIKTMNKQGAFKSLTKAGII